MSINTSYMDALWPEVEIIGPGTHAVEVLIDGLHESRSEPRVMLKILPVPWLDLVLWMFILGDCQMIT